MNKKLIEKKGWVIAKDDNFPSTNYCLFNESRLTGRRGLAWVRKQTIPDRGVAYYTSYESAYSRLNMELAEGGM